MLNIAYRPLDYYCTVWERISAGEWKTEELKLLYVTNLYVYPDFSQFIQISCCLWMVIPFHNKSFHSQNSSFCLCSCVVIINCIRVSVGLGLISNNWGMMSNHRGRHNMITNTNMGWDKLERCTHSSQTNLQNQ